MSQMLTFYELVSGSVEAETLKLSLGSSLIKWTRSTSTNSRSPQKGESFIKKVN